MGFIELLMPDYILNPFKMSRFIKIIYIYVCVVHVNLNTFLIFSHISIKTRGSIETRFRVFFLSQQPDIKFENYLTLVSH